MQAIDFIAPVSRQMQLGELTLSIEPVRMMEAAKLIRAVEPALAELYILAQSDALSPDRLLALVASFGDEMLEAVAIMARCERRIIDALLPDQFTLLAALCIEVNQDFFRKALPSILAQLPSLAPSLHKALARAGKIAGAAPQTQQANAATPAPGQPPVMS